MTLRTRPVDASDYPAIAGLLAARHRRDRTAFPFLPIELEAPEAWQEFEQLMDVDPDDPIGDGIAVVAERDGRLAGFMCSHWMRPSLVLDLGDEGRWEDRQLPSGGVTYESHAVAEHEDHGLIAAVLYGDVGAAWRRNRLTHHSVSVSAVDAGECDAWLDLEFARADVTMVRNVSPLDASLPAGVTVRRAGLADADLLLRLLETAAAERSAAPTFRPRSRDTRAELMDNIERQCSADDTAIFIAAVDGRDVGMCVSTDWPDASPLGPEDGGTVFDCFVLPAARRRGVGTALLDAALRFAWEWDRQQVELTVEGAALPVRRLLGRHGFRPFQWHLERRLDERLLRTDLLGGEALWSRPDSPRGR